MRCRRWVTGPGVRPLWSCVGDNVRDELAEPEELTALARLEAGDSSGGRVKLPIVMFFWRYWCGPKFGADTPLEYAGRTGSDSEEGAFILIVFPGPVSFLKDGSGSRNRTVGGADLRLRSAPTDLEGFKGGFIDERLVTLVDMSLLADDTLG